MELPEKECEICGVWFQPTRSYQKYCPDCGHKSEKKKMYMEKNIRISLAKYGTGRKPAEHEAECENCGKVFFYYGPKRRFCSKGCRIQYGIEHTFCKNCGKPMTDTENPEYTESDWFCSDSCKAKYEWQLAEKEGRIRTCPNCGKQFIDKNTTYCSRDCYSAWIKTHKQNHKPLLLRLRTDADEFSFVSKGIRFQRKSGCTVSKIQEIRKGSESSLFFLCGKFVSSSIQLLYTDSDTC